MTTPDETDLAIARHLEGMGRHEIEACAVRLAEMMEHAKGATMLSAGTRAKTVLALAVGIAAINVLLLDPSYEQ